MNLTLRFLPCVNLVGPRVRIFESGGLRRTFLYETENETAGRKINEQS